MALFRCSSGGGGGLTPTTLWTNPNASNEFNSSTITLSGSMAGYDYIGISYKASTTNSSSMEVIVSLSDFQSTSGSGKMRVALAGIYGSNNYNVRRAVQYVSATSISITGATRVGNSGTYDLSMIPLAVKGYTC